MTLQVAVIGGGIGGLSAALAMLKAGCDVHDALMATNGDRTLGAMNWLYAHDAAHVV